MSAKEVGNAMDPFKSRTSVSLPEHLAAVKRSLSCSEPLSSWDSITIVVGNDSCDLDSAVCALIYAYHLFKSSTPSERSLFIPVLNILREDFALKSEVVFALSEQGIQKEHLVFFDDINVPQLMDRKQLQLILVDHNSPVGNFARFPAEVVEIVDHHASASKRRSGQLRCTIEAVGSCATLIAEKLLNRPESGSLSCLTASLLYQAIILDTVNFSPEAYRGTGKDRQIANNLLTMIPNPQPPQRILAKLQEAKADMGSLGSQQLLQKDLKIIITGLAGKELRLGVASLPALIKDHFSSTTQQAEVQRFCENSSLIGLVLLGIAISDQPVRRDVLVYTANPHHVDTIFSSLSEHTQKSLDLLTKSEPCTPNSANFRYLFQANSSISRKQVLPLLQTVLNAIGTGEYLSGVSISHDDDENESSLDNYETAVPPNSYAGEGFLDDSQSVLGRVSQRVQQMDASRRIAGRNGPDSPMEAGAFDYDARDRNEPFTPSNTYVEESTLLRAGNTLQSNNVGMLHKKVAHLRRRQEKADFEDEEKAVDKDAEGSIFEMEDEISTLPRTNRPRGSL